MYGAVEVQCHRILILATRFRWVVSFRPRPLSPDELTMILSECGLGGSQNRSGRCRENTQFIPLSVIEHKPRGRQAHSLIITWFLLNDQRDAQFFIMHLFICLTLFSSTSCSSLGDQIVSIQPLVAVTLCRWPCCVQVGSETSDLHTTRPPTQIDSYQRLYWHNLSFLMMSTMCSKHVES